MIFMDEDDEGKNVMSVAFWVGIIGILVSILAWAMTGCVSTKTYQKLEVEKQKVQTDCVRAQNEAYAKGQTDFRTYLANAIRSSTPQEVAEFIVKMRPVVPADGSTEAITKMNIDLQEISWGLLKYRVKIKRGKGGDSNVK